MASDLTAADLARWEALAEAATAGPWLASRSLGRAATDILSVAQEQPRWLAGMGELVDAAFIAASREAVPALVAAVRDLARAIVAQEHAGPMGWCPWCGVGLDVAHDPACIVHTARALAGDAA